MKTSQNGINLIKKFEGCRLYAYKALKLEKYYTIGYGHYGADVAPDMKITQTEAEDMLKKDLARFEKAVSKIECVKGKQNAFDALVSFAYNCGEGNLTTLCTGRDLPTIAEKMKLYNKASGVVINGLTTRRIEESALLSLDIDSKKIAKRYFPKVTANTSSIVDCLKSIGVDSTYNNRKYIAVANGINGYSGKASENLQLVNLLKNGICLMP